MAKKRSRFLGPTLYNGVSYAQNRVVDLDAKDASVLGDTVEAADDGTVDAESDRLMKDATAVDERREADVTSEPGYAPDFPDASRD